MRHRQADPFPKRVTKAPVTRIGDCGAANGASTIGIHNTTLTTIATPATKNSVSNAGEAGCLFKSTAEYSPPITPVPESTDVINPIARPRRDGGNMRFNMSGHTGAEKPAHNACAKLIAKNSPMALAGKTGAT
jgi:hypothetical protein